MYSRSQPILGFAVLCALFLGAPSLSGQQDGAAPADPPGVRRMSLADAVARVEGSNLDLRLARQELSAARARAISASARANPGIAANREQLSGGGQSYGGGQGYGGSQSYGAGQQGYGSQSYRQDYGAEF